MTFTDVTRESGLLQLEDHWNSGAVFLDYDRDSHLDLFVSNYVAYETHGGYKLRAGLGIVGIKSDGSESYSTRPGSASSSGMPTTAVVTGKPSAVPELFRV